MTGIKSMVAYNGREIPTEDKLFAATAKATEAIAEYGAESVINATVGALFDDEGKLIVLKSVERIMNSLPPESFAAYSPIEGTPGFRQAILKAAFGNYKPKSCVGVVAVPGGTAALRNAIANYSQPGDRILTHSWHWAPYKSIATELYRDVEHFKMFDESGRFNAEDFGYRVKKLTRNQEHLVIILNTPAGNPTGYSLTMDDWYGVKSVLDEVPLEKKVALVLDAAYMDYAGDPEKIREFLKVVDNLRANILPVMAYSASKTFTLYGARCAAMICLAHNSEIADEFVRINKFSSRSTWSNPPRAPQEVIEHIFADSSLLAEVEAERAGAREMLLARGRAFEESAKECGLEILPFSAGFFITVPCSEPELICSRLNEKKAFLIPLDRGVRVSVAACSEEKCRRLPFMIKETMNMI